LNALFHIDRGTGKDANLQRSKRDLSNFVDLVKNSDSPGPEAM